MPHVTAILPCRNEAAFVDACLTSVLGQQLDGLELEVIVADGASDDGTREILERWAERDPRLRILDNLRRTMPTGVNMALRQARGSVVALMGAHCVYPPDYLERCVRTLERSGADVVGGVLLTRSAGRGLGGRVVQAVSTHRFGVGGAGFRTGAEEGPVDTVAYGCYRREVFDRVGGFDERLVRNQDYEMSARIRAAGGRIWLDPSIHVEYFNQGTFAGLLRQARVTGRWNAFTWYLAPYAFRSRHAVPGLFFVLVLPGGLVALVDRGLDVLYMGGLVLYAVLAVLTSIQQAGRYRDARLVVLLPAAFFAYHLSYGWGVVLGAARCLFGQVPFRSGARPWEGATAFRIDPRSGPWSS